MAADANGSNICHERIRKAGCHIKCYSSGKNKTAIFAVKNSEETGQQAIAAATAGIDVLHKILRRGTAHYNSGNVDTFLVVI